jgi:hypothetical protein
MDASPPAAPKEKKAKPPRNSLSDKRLAREWKTMTAMIRIFCRSKHQTAAGLCTACQELQDYAKLRLEQCRFGPEKPTCANCPVHCYQRSRREEIREVMRLAGPRMLWEHPMLSVRHWLDGFRKAQCATDAAASEGRSSS